MSVNIQSIIQSYFANIKPYKDGYIFNTPYHFDSGTVISLFIKSINDNFIYIDDNYSLFNEISSLNILEFDEILAKIKKSIQKEHNIEIEKDCLLLDRMIDKNYIISHIDNIASLCKKIFQRQINQLKTQSSKKRDIMRAELYDVLKAKYKGTNVEVINDYEIESFSGKYYVMLTLKKNDQKRYINFVDQDERNIINKTIVENIDISKSDNFNYSSHRIYTEIDDSKLWSNESKLRISLSSGIIERNDAISNKVGFEI
jgi:hypothetical protein